MENTPEKTLVLALAHDIKKLISESRQQVAIGVNAALTLLYWHIGNRINAEILKGNRFISENITSKTEKY